MNSQRAPFRLWTRIVCDILFCAVTAAAAYVATGSLCGAILIAAPFLGFLGPRRARSTTTASIGATTEGEDSPGARA
ncbi:hypothetical protein [Streptomyces coeruleorubidus]|uniref:hypothetical protein n=1 Tax=Streptomyces coeruleorubidus TaxID=116188 RepID=UPI0037A8996C